MSRIAVASLLTVIGIAGCKPGATPVVAGMDATARDYLLLELGMGLHDPAHVDAYFGPPELRQEATDAALSLPDIAVQARELSDRLKARAERPDLAADERMRVAGLLQRLGALTTRIDIHAGKRLPFDEESLRLFDAVAPDRDADYFRGVLAEIDALLPGTGTLSTRVNRFRERFAIPSERLAAVFDAAIAECRRRTLEHIALPEAESFEVEYVHDKPWSGYNWYQGHAHSLIQVNTDLPIFINRAVDLGCHEGYPGHHTYNALLEQNLVIGKGWIEYSLYPLFSAQSLIAEGSGNYGIDLAFPGDERVRFETEVLFPLAGLDPADAGRYYALLALLDKLGYASNEAARDYLNGVIDRDQAEQWLVDYTLASPERARQRVDFFDTYRSYVINYNLGEDMVRDYVERDAPDQAARWERFEHLLSTAMLPADL